MWFIFGLFLMTLGLFLFLWALKTLSLKTSLGLKGKLITNGPYKYSRNPQYLGFNVFLLGAVLFFNSYFVVITGLIGIILFFFAAITEESWLKEQFKEEYHIYCKTV